MRLSFATPGGFVSEKHNLDFPIAAMPPHCPLRGKFEWGVHEAIKYLGLEAKKDPNRDDEAEGAQTKIHQSNGAGKGAEPAGPRLGHFTAAAAWRVRPAPTGKGVQVVVRLQPDPLAALDKWAAKQSDRPTGAEAIRRLVELGLTVKTPARPASKSGRRLRARELATTAIEKIIDPAAPPKERAQRRRKLIKGTTGVPRRSRRPA